MKFIFVASAAICSALFAFAGDSGIAGRTFTDTAVLSPGVGFRATGGNSATKGESGKPIFDENWGPKARMLGQAAQEASDWIDRTKVWTEGLQPVPLTLFLVGAGILVVGSFWAFFKYLPVYGIPSGVMAGVLVTSVVAGLTFTIWLAFHISGTVGENIAMTIMGLLGVSVALAVGGGLVYGKGLVCKLLAPVLMLVVSGTMFFLIMWAVLLVIVIVGAVLIFDFLRKAAFGSNG